MRFFSAREFDVRPLVQARAMYRTMDEARRAFARYASLDPRLEKLWHECYWASPTRGPEANADDVGDDSNHDPAAGWCAEDYFFREVKPKMVALVGWNRSADPPELRTSTAYEAVYMALFQFALSRTCACCAEPDDRQANQSEIYEGCIPPFLP
ncbi:MAG TPA: hypothetical protein VMJ10_14125 [Kofleriaceae bacterium]|nr:hypothetical protein [Kofleriaceae bacterium]